MDMAEVNGRVSPPPRLKLGSLSDKPNTVAVDKFKCHYNLLKGKTLVAGKSAERWALIYFSSGDRRNWLNGNFFIPKLTNRCRSLGVQMEELLTWVVSLVVVTDQLQHIYVAEKCC